MSRKFHAIQTNHDRCDNHSRKSSWNAHGLLLFLLLLCDGVARPRPCPVSPGMICVRVNKLNLNPPLSPCEVAHVGQHLRRFASCCPQRRGRRKPSPWFRAWPQWDHPRQILRVDLGGSCEICPRRHVKFGTHAERRAPALTVPPLASDAPATANASVTPSTCVPHSPKWLWWQQRQEKKGRTMEGGIPLHVDATFSCEMEGMSNGGNTLAAILGWHPCLRHLHHDASSLRHVARYSVRTHADRTFQHSDVQIAVRLGNRDLPILHARDKRHWCSKNRFSWHYEITSSCPSTSRPLLSQHFEQHDGLSGFAYTTITSIKNNDITISQKNDTVSKKKKRCEYFARGHHSKNPKHSRLLSSLPARQEGESRDQLIELFAATRGKGDVVAWIN